MSDEYLVAKPRTNKQHIETEPIGEHKKISTETVTSVTAYEMLSQAQFGERLQRFSEKRDVSIDTLQKRCAKLMRDADALERDLSNVAPAQTVQKQLDGMREGIAAARLRPLEALRAALATPSTEAPADVDVTLAPCPAASDKPTDAALIRAMEARVAELESRLGRTVTDEPLASTVGRLTEEVAFIKSGDATLTGLHRTLGGLAAQARKLRDVIGDGAGADVAKVVGRLNDWEARLPQIAWVLERMQTLAGAHQQATNVAAAVRVLERGQAELAEDVRAARETLADAG